MVELKIWIRVKTAIILIGLALAGGSGFAQSKLPEASKPLASSGQLLFEHAMSLYRAGTPDDRREALSSFLRAAEDFKSAQEPARQGMSLLGAGFVSSSLGADRDALGHFNQALLLFRKTRHRQGEVDALVNIGAAHYGLKEMDSALDNFQKALELSRKIGERKGAANALTGIAQVHAVRKELEKAINAYNEALPLLNAVGDREGEARARHNLNVIVAQLREQKPRK
jgi:tetratricopeptide (TPR) repeat protein